MKKDNEANITNHLSYGNEVLYKMCNDSPKHENENIVGSKMWIIGRSYSASPQRRKKPKSDKQKKYDYFFTKLAKYFMNNLTMKEIDEKISNINNSQYTGQYEKDLTLIKDIIIFIDIFNKAIKQSIQKIDNIDDANLENVKNNISFASKYLHFHCPNLIFIYDSFSFSNARYRSQTLKKDIGLDNKIKELKHEIDKPELDEYIAHFLRCYFISIKNEFDKFLTPREVDNLLLN